MLEFNILSTHYAQIFRYYNGKLFFCDMEGPCNVVMDPLKGSEVQPDQWVMKMSFIEYEEAKSLNLDGLQSGGLVVRLVHAGVPDKPYDMVLDKDDRDCILLECDRDSFTDIYFCDTVHQSLKDTSDDSLDLNIRSIHYHQTFRFANGKMFFCDLESIPLVSMETLNGSEVDSDNWLMKLSFLEYDEAKDLKLDNLEQDGMVIRLEHASFPQKPIYRVIDSLDRSSILEEAERDVFDHIYFFDVIKTFLQSKKE